MSGDASRLPSLPTHLSSVSLSSRRFLGSSLRSSPRHLVTRTRRPKGDEREGRGVRGGSEVRRAKHERYDPSGLSPSIVVLSPLSVSLHSGLTRSLSVPFVHPSFVSRRRGGTTGRRERRDR